MSMRAAVMPETGTCDSIKIILSDLIYNNKIKTNIFKFIK